MNIRQRLRDAMQARRRRVQPDVEQALRQQQSPGNPKRAAVRRPIGAALVTGAAVVVLAAAIPLVAHAVRTHRKPGAEPITMPTGQAAASPTPRASAPGVAKTPIGTPSAAVTVAGPKARLFIEDFAGTGATFYLTGVRVETADGAPLAGYQLPAHPPAGAFTVSTDGTRIAYLAADGIHVANAIDGTQDRIVHALPFDRSRPDPASEAAQLPFANWARGSVISWSGDGSFAVAWQGCLWTLAADGSSLTEIARNTTSTPVEGAGGVVDATWSSSSDQLLVSVDGSAKLLNDATQQTLAAESSTGSGIATAIVAANGTAYRLLAGQEGPWYWSPDGTRVVGWNAAGTSLVTVAVSGGAPHTVATLAAGVTLAVSPDGTRVAALGPNNAVDVWPIDGGPATTVRAVSVMDAGQQQLAWLDPQQLILSTAGPDGTTRLTIVHVTGATHALPDLHPSTASGYLVIDVHPGG
jgi:hypothetical protein